MIKRACNKYCNSHTRNWKKKKALRCKETSNFHVKFYLKKGYRYHGLAISAISVFCVKFNQQFPRQAMIVSLGLASVECCRLMGDTWCDQNMVYSLWKQLEKQVKGFLEKKNKVKVLYMWHVKIVYICDTWMLRIPCEYHVNFTNTLLLAANNTCQLRTWGLS